MFGINADLQSQITYLTKIITLNDVLFRVIEKANKIDLDDYYIGAGCIAQTIWNYQTGLELTHGISDIDIVYYDDSDLSLEAEKAVFKE